MTISELGKYIPQDFADYIQEWFAVPDNATILRLPELRQSHYVQSGDTRYVIEIQEFRKQLLHGGMLEYYAGYCKELNTLYFW